MKVYAKTRACLQIFFVLTALFLLSACGVNYSAPWSAPANTGVVTKDPNSIPDIAWQTQNQRHVLTQQNDKIAQQQAEAAVAVAAAAPPPPRKVTVSLLLPLSGKKAELGQSMLKAAQMAMFDIGSANFVLVPRDTKSTAAGAAAAAQSAVDAHNDLILGPVFSDDLKAVKPVVSASGIPVIAFTTDWSLTGNNTYIMGFLPFAQVTRAAKFAQSRGYAKFAVYAPQTEYCDAVIHTLQGSGVSVVHVNRYSPEQPDLSNLVQDFAATSKNAATPNQLDFDALMLPLGNEGLKSLVTLLGVSGIDQTKVKFIGTGLWDDAGLTSDPSLHGGWFAAPDPALRADFERRYQVNFSALPQRLASLAYDATALAAVLARTFPPDVSPYGRDILTNPRGFAGIDGIFRFRPDGLSERGLAMLEVRSGRMVVVDPAPTAFIAPSGT